MSDQDAQRNFWRDRRVFVTGGTGLVGGWLTERLVDLQADVVALVRDWVPGSRFVELGLDKKVSVVRGDIRDQAMLERALGEYEIDTVIDLAAQTIVGIANRNPVSTFETNIAGTWCLLEAVRRSPTVKAVVLASSDKAYGSARVLPYVETTPLNTGGSNSLHEIDFGTFQNAKVTLNGQEIRSGQVVSIPGGATSIDFTVERLPAERGVLVPFTVVDGCGDWPTFVGTGRGGP